MGECALPHRESGRVVAARCLVACAFWARLRGWIGRRPADGEALWLVPCASVHTVGMRARIDVLFCARDGEVIKAVRRLRPCRFARARGAAGACELPSGAAAGVVAGDHLDRVGAGARSLEETSGAGQRRLSSLCEQ